MHHVGVAAARRYDRNGFGWFALSMVLSPVIAGLLLLALGPVKPNRAAAALEQIRMAAAPGAGRQPGESMEAHRQRFIEGA